ncbi:hypothetical protein GLOIN_2v1577360 [Rhizophagus irregularis DAOM 181602=DAOM 197198]|uniref:Uncharacterized protein n=1 Tax=Rhizophagus irregularis (strain DAOM 181602 / DAOM 197198 / MUCL 43194) TaxID=747089 RepID=A0A2P4Q9F5_RHIID|nr:hypothetical protein GLOIN_2v1577360 [Rhizophagus irregularis DAOM 181602=DAOM 197198]POG74274.1 hypothetical protein GLOIN_2v1577360 [Rhizophagus irregularis DAOM 181602=DAOM 197198]|eukprot:XP_025181140.1 hypothetical protein GLOIN_2v1577360 [Rhizophagus irregularis DAOM 181602=DAOM 197198]
MEGYFLFHNLQLLMRLLYMKFLDNLVTGMLKLVKMVLLLHLKEVIILVLKARVRFGHLILLLYPKIFITHLVNFSF